LRILIADVILLLESDWAKVRIGIRWHAGTADQFSIARLCPSGISAATPLPAAELIRRLGPTAGNDDLVTILSQYGYRTGAGRPFDVKAVQWVCRVYGIFVPSSVAVGEIPPVDAVRQLGCPLGVVYYWIETGQLKARRGIGNRLCIPWTPAT